MKLSPEFYESNSSLKIAFTDGRLAMCEEIRDMIHHIMAQSHINPFKENTDFQEGQLFALTAIIQQCMILEESEMNEDTEPIRYDA
jgi:hypothetical protein